MSLCRFSHGGRLAQLCVSTDFVKGRNIIEPVLEGLTQQEVGLRIETLLVMTRSLAVHTGTRPVSERQVLASGFERAFRGVLSPP